MMLMPSVFRSNVNDLFGDFAQQTRRAAQSFVQMSGVMKTDIKESEEGFELLVDLPGFEKENVKAELKDGYLTIQATRETTSEEKDEQEKFIRRERYAGSCKRTFFVGDEVTEEDIKAKFENGTLKMTIPRKEEIPPEDAPKAIEIEG